MRIVLNDYDVIQVGKLNPGDVFRIMSSGDNKTAGMVLDMGHMVEPNTECQWVNLETGQIGFIEMSTFVIPCPNAALVYNFNNGLEPS